MEAQEYLSRFYCSEEFNQGLDNKGISLSAINILLGITAIIGNTVILIALCKETSLNKPSKVLLRDLVVSDLCVGFVQLVFGARDISILQGRWQTCRHLSMVVGIAANISITVSLFTITAISEDRLSFLIINMTKSSNKSDTFVVKLSRSTELSVIVLWSIPQTTNKPFQQTILLFV